MKKADNIVFNYRKNEYDAYKKEYPTTLGSQNFQPESIKNIKTDAKPFFVEKFNEIKEEYDLLLDKLKWNELIFKSDIRFNPIIGKRYHLYNNKNSTFLSIIKPKEWNMKYLGTFILESNHTWKKIK